MTNHAHLIAALRIPMNVTLPGAPELDEYDEQRKVAADALEDIQKSNEAWWKNSLETWSAMRAMRDAINEYIPMPSLESDLLRGPENSVFCATVAETVIVAIEAVWAEATAAAYGAAARIAEEGAIATEDNGIASWIEDRINAHTPQSARDWLAEREAAIRAEERAKVISMAAHRMDNGWSYLAGNAIRGLHTDASRAIPIKEKDDE